MISLKKIISITILPLIMFSFSQCSSQKKLQQDAPVKLQEVYCQGWVAGVKGGGAGMNIFIPVDAVLNKKVKLDSVYFRGKAARLETKPQNESLYIGRFMSNDNKSRDLIMSSDSKNEYGNKMPVIPAKTPFELKDDECAVSYKDGNKTKYFKIENVIEKASIPYPSAPQNTLKIKQ